MKSGDLVKLSATWTSPTAIEYWGYGLVDTVYESKNEVEVIWPKQAYTSRTLPKSRVEVL